MKKLITTVILAAAVISCDKAANSLPTVASLENDDQKAAYAYGMNVGQQVMDYSVKTAEAPLDIALVEKAMADYYALETSKRESYATGFNIGTSVRGFLKAQELDGVLDEKIVAQGILDVLKEKNTLMAKEEIDAFMNNYLQGLADAEKKTNNEKSANFLAEKAKDSKVTTTASGLMYEVIQEGNGASPTLESRVEVNYVGKTMDGKTFDESKDPVQFPLNGVILGWQEGLQLMKVGAKYKFYIPSELAYGEFGTPDKRIGPNEVLIFDVELLSVEN